MSELQSTEIAFDLEDEAVAVFEKMNDYVEQYARETIRDIDWNQHRICDLVCVNDRALTKRDPQCLPSIRRYTYQTNHHDLPTLKEYEAMIGKPCYVYRLSEEMCRIAGIDPETGQPLSEA